MSAARTAMALVLLACLAPVTLASGPAEALATLRRAEAVSPTQARALRQLVREGLAQGGEQASNWALLDLWLAAEWEDGADLPARRSSFRSNWPDSRFQEEADWLLARWRLRQGELLPSARLLLTLATARDGALRDDAGRLLETLCDAELTDAELDSLAGEADGAGRNWLGAWRAGLRLKGKLLLVAPLSGPDAALGLALKKGAEGALRQRDSAGRKLELLTADCQSDPWLARDLLARRGPEADAVLLPGEVAYLGALAGECGSLPALVPAHGGPPLEDLAPGLLQFGLDVATQGRLLAKFARDSLAVDHLQSLAPVTRPSRRLIEALHAELDAEGKLETGQDQWYFGGARDMAPQLENLGLFDAGFKDTGAWVVLGAEREAPALLALLAALPPRGWVLGDGGLLAAVGDRVPPALAGRLFILTDWLPPAYAGLAGQAGAGDLVAWSGFARELEARDGRSPSLTETQAFESTRLLALAWDEAASRRRGLEGVLATLEASSLYGGSLGMAGQRARGGLLLAWTAKGWKVLGQRKA